MSVFGNILAKIFHHKPAAPAPTPTPAPPVRQVPPAPAPSGAPASAAPAAQPPATPASAPAPAVDVAAVLTEMAALKEGGGGNWRTSINDLLRLLDLDNSLSARHELAEELGVRVGADGSAEQNIALHKAVMRKLAENGGVVPDSLRD